MNYKQLIVTFLILSIKISGFGQTVSMKTTLDTVQKTISTTLVFQQLSAMKEVRWQQRLLPDVTIRVVDNSSVVCDTSNQLLTLIWKSFPPSDTVLYSFTVNFNSEIPTPFSWGEGSVLYVDKNNILRKLRTNPQVIEKNPLPVNDSLTRIDSVYYIQVGVGSKNRHANYSLYQGDKIYMVKADNLYKYQVGPYETPEIAKKRLPFYKKHCKDAFIVKSLRK